MGDVYREILNEDEVIFDKSKIPESTARGSYRKLISMVHDLTWEPVVDATDTDADATNTSSSCVVDEMERRGKESICAAKFKFELSSGSYATMMLRELLCTKI